MGYQNEFQTDNYTPLNNLSRDFFFLTYGLSWGSDHVTLIGLSGVVESAEFDVGQ
jgi:hypothetical protein